MKKYPKIYVLASDLYNLLSFEGFSCRLAHNKMIITCAILHETCDPLPGTPRKTLERILRGWLIDHHPDLPLATVSDILNEAQSDPHGETRKPLAIREHWECLYIIADMKQVREAEDFSLTRQRARDLCNELLQNRDVYGNSLSLRDIERIGSVVFGEISRRQSAKIMTLLETKSVAECNGNMKSLGRDVNFDKLKEFLRT